MPRITPTIKIIRCRLKDGSRTPVEKRRGSFGGLPPPKSLSALAPIMINSPRKVDGCSETLFSTGVGEPSFFKIFLINNSCLQKIQKSLKSISRRQLWLRKFSLFRWPFWGCWQPPKSKPILLAQKVNSPPAKRPKKMSVLAEVMKRDACPVRMTRNPTKINGETLLSEEISFQYLS